MQDRFVCTAHPSRVVFGAGSLAALADEVKALGCCRAFVLTTRQQEATGADVVAQLGPLAAGLFPRAAMHTPIAVTERALAAFEAAKADCTVAIGGGSTTGLGKALALRTNLPQIVVPTTYAGSEMTNILGETADGKKTTQRSSFPASSTPICKRGRPGGSRCCSSFTPRTRLARCRRSSPITTPIRRSFPTRAHTTCESSCPRPARRGR